MQEGTKLKAEKLPKPVASVLSPLRSLMHKPMLWILLLAFGARVAARWYSGEADFWVNGYGFLFELAQNIAAGRGIAFDGAPPTAFRVPLYPAFLALVTFGHKLFLPVLIFQSLIGVGTVCCAALLARDLFGRAAAIPAAALTAVYPYYVVHDTALQETSLFTFLTAVAVLLLVRARQRGSSAIAVCAGVALGGAVLTRASLAPFAMLAPIWLVLPRGTLSRAWQKRLRSAAFCASSAALIVSPWLIHSYLLTGSPTLSTETGQQLWTGNNPRTFGHYPYESIDISKNEGLKALDTQERAEIQAIGADRWFRQKGLEYISDHPWQTFRDAMRKIVAAFGLLPSPRKSFWPNLAHALHMEP